MPVLDRGGTYPETSDDAFSSALLGSNFDEGSAPFVTPNGRRRTVAVAAGEVGDDNVGVLSTFSVPLQAPQAAAV